MQEASKHASMQVCVDMCMCVYVLFAYVCVDMYAYVYM